MSRLALGFNARISFRTGDDEQGLRDGIALFEAAEDLGFDTGWVYQRHFDNYLANPLTFLAAVGQHTSRISLGTAVIAMRYENPILLAEAAATADLLTGRRLKLAISTGTGDFDSVFGAPVDDARAEAQRRLARFLAAVRGEVVGYSDATAGGDGGEPLRVRPHSDTLIDRIYYGSTTVDAAERTARQQLNLLLGTIISETRGLDFAEYHALMIEHYRQTVPQPARARIGVSRSVLPATTPESARRYREYDEQRRREGPGASRPAGALAPRALPDGFAMCPVYHGDPARVVDDLLADRAVAAADELVLFLPPEFTVSENIRLLTDVVDKVAPHLGWRPQSSNRPLTKGDHDDIHSRGTAHRMAGLA
ncbi:LLM class flavin-dependent oxidoreductase [Gordonia sp. DT30]|uniref:LLM class flavin-dependent oxidoreductase n=1 Tax=Gordonia sp. DT30 TaxID=3416546 RepID=UPI003CED06FA